MSEWEYGDPILFGEDGAEVELEVGSAPYEMFAAFAKAAMLVQRG